jgi:hypothetical protein
VWWKKEREEKKCHY